MAAVTCLAAKTVTLTSTTADTITFSQSWGRIEITNHTTNQQLNVCFFTTATADGDNNQLIPSSSSKVFNQLVGPIAGGVTVSIVGNGNKYTVEGVD